MQISTKEASDIFKKLRFRKRDCKHHIRGYLEVDGEVVLAAYYSFGKKDLPGKISDKFRISLSLSNNEFDILRKCHIDRNGYIQILKSKGKIRHR